MKDVMTLINEENESDKYEIFCSFDSDKTGKSYIIYTGHYENENKQLVLNAGSYKVIDENTLYVNRKLTHEENEMLSSIMSSVFEQFENLIKENEKKKK